jgi:hypothetical protein
MGTAMNPASLSISPGALQSYGAIPVGGASAPRTFTVRNAAGSAPSGPIAMVTGSSDFVLAGDGCSGVSLAGGSTCTVDVIYRPTAIEGDAGQVSAQANPGGAAGTSLQGTGESALRFTAEPAFSPPAVSVNASVDRTFVLENAAAPPGGTSPPTTGFLVTTLGGGGQFAVLLDMCVGRRLAAGDSCTVLIRFTPTTAGSHGGTLNLSATPGGGDTAALTGQGT